MKVKFTIEKETETEKDGVFKTKEVDMYILTATFTLSVSEEKIYNEHPLFKNLVFLEYNEVDKWTTGIIFKEKQAVDRNKQITIESIFSYPEYTFRAYSVPRIVELRKLVVDAGIQFAKTIEVLEKLEGSDEFDFKPGDINETEINEL